MFECHKIKIDDFSNASNIKIPQLSFNIKGLDIIHINLNSWVE